MEELCNAEHILLRELERAEFPKIIQSIQKLLNEISLAKSHLMEMVRDV